MKNDKENIIAKNVAKWKANKAKMEGKKANKKIKHSGVAFDAIKEALEDALAQKNGD